MKELEQINVADVPTKYKTDYKEKFWKDRYNAHLDEDKKAILNDILGSNNALWHMAFKKGIEFDSIKQESLESEFENKREGYIGRMSGDLICKYKGTVRLGYPAETYYRNYTKYINTNGFW